MLSVTETDSNVSGVAAGCPNAAIEMNANRLAVEMSPKVFIHG